MIVQLDTENADRDIKTAIITVLTHTPDASNPMLCQGLVCFGDGAKDLDGTGGDFELTVTVGGQTVQPDPQVITFSTAVRASVWTTQFPVPANTEVILRVLSPNAADSDVDVTAYLYQVDAVEVVDVAADAITAASINTGALTADAFAADAIVAATLATGAISADAFAADAIVAATLATGALSADAFAADALVAATFATGAFTADAFAANAIIAATLATDTYTAIESECNDALVALKLDHLLAVADADDVVNNIVIAKMAATAGDWSTFVDTTDSLQSIRDKQTDIETDTAYIGVPVALDGGAATVGGMLTKMADDNGGADFDAATDSLAEITAAIVIGFPTNEHADVEPGGGTVVTGTNTANDGDSTWLNDGTYWQIAAAAADGDGFGLSVIQTFTLGITQRASQVLINAKETLVGVVHVWAYNYTTASWDQLSDAISAISGAADNDYSFALLSDHQQAGDGEVQIRYTSTDTSVGKYLYLDQAIVSTVSSGVTAAEYADAVWANRFGHDVAHHVPKYTGHLWFVDGTDGLDTNPGDYVHGAFKTIGAAIAAASAGDRITVKAGTYTETGLDLNLAGLELHGEAGTIIDPATGSALTVSADHCFVCDIEVRPAAGEIGFDVASGSDFSRFTDVISSTSGGTGMKIDSATSYIVVTRSQMCEYTSVGVELNGVECILDQVVCRGDGGTETGFLLNHTNAHRNLLNACASIDNATLGYGLVAGADDNMIQMSTSSAGDGGTLGRSDAGTNNSWRGYIPGEIALATLANGAHGGAAASLTLASGLAANITGNLSGSVGSVTGAVGSVTGAVGSVTGAVGSVTGSVGSVTGAVGSVAGNVDGSVASVTGAVGSVTGAVGSVTGLTPGNLDVAVSTRSSHTAANVWAVGSRTLTSFGTLVADTATAVWSAGARTLTSFGTLVADATAAVWGAGARTLTAFGFTVTTDAASRTASKATGFAVAGDAMALTDDAITAAKFDESTAFPVKSTDTGSTKIARTGADGDTLETLSDEIAAASAPTAAQNADAVWDEARTGHTTAGTFGYYLDAAISSVGGTGSGADEVTLTIDDDAGDPISDADVWISTDESGATVVAGTLQTNAVGEVTFMLDAGVTYFCWRQKDGENFSNPQSFVAVADA